MEQHRNATDIALQESMLELRKEMRETLLEAKKLKWTCVAVFFLVVLNILLESL